jgi:hypothetical protein
MTQFERVKPKRSQLVHIREYCVVGSQRPADILGRPATHPRHHQTSLDVPIAPNETALDRKSSKNEAPPLSEFSQQRRSCVLCT